MGNPSEIRREFRIFAPFQAREGAENELIQAFREMLPEVRAEEGCVATNVFRATRVAGLFYIHSRWRDEDAFNRHAEMPHTLRFVARAQELLTHDLQVIRTQLVE